MAEQTREKDATLQSHESDIVCARSEMVEARRVPSFESPSLLHLAPIRQPRAAESIENHVVKSV